MNPLFLFLLLIPAAAWLWTRSYRAPWHGPAPDVDDEGFDRLHRYARHLSRRLRRDAKDPTLPPDVRQRAARGHADLESMLGAHPLTDDLRRWIRLVESTTAPSHPRSSP